ncbi:hypothetical protein WA171_005977 [Blastocystis sp. BT1]
MSVADAIGIDLGTSNTVSAIVKNGRVEVIANELGDRVTPSYVAFPPKKNPPLIVGKLARNRLKTRPEGVIHDCKRLMGVKYSDCVVQQMKKTMTFDIVDVNDEPMISVTQSGQSQLLCPENIGAYILSNVQSYSSRFAGKQIKNAVVTVPAYFNQIQIQKTKDACRIAGLNPIGVITEPVAAVYAYAECSLFNDDNEHTVLIYDLGGGTFDATIMKIKGSEYTQIGIDGDKTLGGSTIDAILMQWMIEQYEASCGTTFDRKYYGKLRFQCEAAKIDLRQRDESEIEIDDDSLTITIANLNSLIRPIIAHSIEICDRLITSCKIQIGDIDDIVLVGGSSRLRLVHSMLTDHYHRVLKESINPDECVAYGAAKYAYFLNRNESIPVVMKNIIVSSTCPSDIGVDINGRMFAVIPRNASLPCRYGMKCCNERDYCKRINVNVYQGNAAENINNVRLRTISIKNFTPQPRGKNVFTILFNMDKTGVLNISIRDESTGIVSRYRNIQANLSEEEITAKRTDLESLERETESYMLLQKRINEVQTKMYDKLLHATNESVEATLRQLINEVATVVDPQQLSIIEARVNSL